MEIPWTIKYRPKNLSGIQGQDKSITAIKKYLSSFEKQKKKALLLHGPPGTGKTSAVFAAAAENDFEILEVNASDKRNKEQIQLIVGNFLTQKSLFMKKKMILIDEIDGLSGHQDRGGVAALVPIIKESKYPIIMTANDGWKQSLKSIRKVATLVQFESLKSTDVYNILKDICKKEKVVFNEFALKSLARKADGDLRGAINDLEMLTRYSKKLAEDHIEEIDDRLKKESILQALVKVFKNSDVDIARAAFDNIDEDLDECMMWIDENLPNEYCSDSLSRAYDALSKADVYRGRIRRWQHWRFLVYINALISAGVANAKSERSKEFISYKRSQRILQMWIAKQKHAKKKSISEKLAKATHTSIRVAMQNFYYLVPVLKNKEIAEQLELNNEEIEWIKEKF